LRLISEAAKGARVDDAVASRWKVVAEGMRRLGIAAPASISTRTAKSASMARV